MKKGRVEREHTQISPPMARTKLSARSADGVMTPKAKTHVHVVAKVARTRTKDGELFMKRWVPVQDDSGRWKRVSRWIPVPPLPPLPPVVDAE